MPTKRTSKPPMRTPKKATTQNFADVIRDKMAADPKLAAEVEAVIKEMKAKQAKGKKPKGSLRRTHQPDRHHGSADSVRSQLDRESDRHHAFMGNFSSDFISRNSGEGGGYGYR